VLAGAADALLDTYEIERLPVAARVLGVSTQLYAGLEQRRLSSLLRRRAATADFELPRHAAGPAHQRADRDAARRRPCTRRERRERAAVQRLPRVALHAGRFDGAPTVDWATAGAPLHTVTITSVAKQLRRDYGVTKPTHILIRPDGYIAYITDRTPDGIDHQTLDRLAPQAHDFEQT